MMEKSPQKERLFRLLESFFLYEEETSEISELCDIFESARSSNTNESYIFLLEKLQSYSKDIPGFVVRNCPTAHGRVLAYIFLTNYNACKININMG